MHWQQPLRRQVLCGKVESKCCKSFVKGAKWRVPSGTRPNDQQGGTPGQDMVLQSLDGPHGRLRVSPCAWEECPALSRPAKDKGMPEKWDNVYICSGIPSAGWSKTPHDMLSSLQ